MNEVSIDTAKCIYCKTCVTICPWGVYSDEGDHIAISKMEQCVACMSCIPACPVDAITVKEEM